MTNAIPRRASQRRSQTRHLACGAGESTPLAGSHGPVQSARGSGIATSSLSEASASNSPRRDDVTDLASGDFLVMHLSSTNRANGSRLKKASLPQTKNAIGFGSLPSREDM